MNIIYTAIGHFPMHNIKICILLSLYNWGEPERAPHLREVRTLYIWVEGHQNLPTSLAPPVCVGAVHGYTSHALCTHAFQHERMASFP